MLFFCLLLTLLTACAAPPQAIDLDLYSDRGFAQQVEEIFDKAAQYEGAAIRLTGQYYESEDYAYILRTAPDGAVHGFELLWEGERPAIGAWILAVGRLQSYREDGTAYFQVAAERLFCTQRSDGALQIGEATFLSDLAQLYDHLEKYLGAQVTLSGRCGVYDGGYYVCRTAAYADGREGEVGLEFLPLEASAEAGEWVTVTGTLCAELRGEERVLTLIDAVLRPSEPAQEPVKETP